MIDLLEVFKDCPEYTIMKIRGDFPKYKKGQDIDIACRDPRALGQYLAEYFWESHDFKTANRDATHIHFDILDGKKIELRFDLYSEFINASFTEAILDEKMFLRYSGYKIWIADYHRDILIKSWEYHVNKKKKYKDYAQYINGLDAYKN